MEIFPLFQARLMLLCCLLGVTSGLFFDFFRAITDVIGIKFNRLSHTVTLISDFLIVMLMGLSLIVLCFYYNKGIFRFFCLFGLAVGLVFYFFVFSNVVFKLYGWIFKVIFSIFSIILRPIFKFIDKTRRNLQIVSYYILKNLAKILFWVYNIYVKKNVERKSRKGFLTTEKDDGGNYDKENGREILR